MVEKRPRDDSHDNDGSSKKQRTGFRVGPAGLPDGTYRRKAQKIKNTLIQKAKTKREFAKLKTRAGQDHLQRPSVFAVDSAPEDHEERVSSQPDGPHPDRVALMNQGPGLDEVTTSARKHREPRERQAFRRRPKPDPYIKEAHAAQKAKEEAEMRQRQKEDGLARRQERIQEREKERRAMAKARQPGRNGQRKLGRESAVLLQRVKRMITNAD